MTTIFVSREKHGECFVSRFDDGLDIPWNPLSLSDFMYYDQQFIEDRIPSAILEEEIFKKCVLDETIKLNFNLLNAGIVTTVAGQIFEFSGPMDPRAIERDLDVARYQVSNFLSDSVSIIIQTFPGYTVKEVEALTYREFLKLLAMAERRLFAMGVIQEPLNPVFEDGEGEQVQASEPVQFRDLNPPEADSYRPPETRRKRKAQKNSDYIATSSDGEMFMPPDGLSGIDLEVYKHLHGDQWKQDAIAGFEEIYPELMQQMRDGKKITPESIRQNRGSNAEVRLKHKQYTERMLSGTVNQQPKVTEKEGESKPKARRTKE